MAQADSDYIASQLVLSDTLRAGRSTMLEPQDLPGRYGRVVNSIDKVLAAIECTAVVGGGWAVWRHGYVGRVTQDIDVVLPTNKIEEFLKVASMGGFQVLVSQPGRWPKLNHKSTDIQVDILPEGAFPGRPPDYAPTSIPHPIQLGGSGNQLRYLKLASLIELKVAAARMKDKADVVELIRNNREQIESVREHLAGVHAQYLISFEALVHEANQDD